MQREDEAMPTRTSSEPSPTEGWKTHHKRVSLDRAEAILSVIAFKLCFIKTSWSHQGTVADAVGTCLVLVIWTLICEGGTDSEKEAWRQRCRRSKTIRYPINVEVRATQQKRCKASDCDPLQRKSRMCFEIWRCWSGHLDTTAKRILHNVSSESCRIKTR